MATIVNTENSLILSDAISVGVFSHQSLKTNRATLSKGQGFFSGSLPDYFIRYSDNTPAPNIKIELLMEGVKVAETFSDESGAWRFDGLDHTKMYDIVARHPTLESVISSKRYPKLIIQSFQTNFTKTSGSDFTRRYIVKGGTAPYEVDVSVNPVSYVINQDLGIIDLTATKVATEETYLIVFSCQNGTNSVVQSFTVPAL